MSIVPAGPADAEAPRTRWQRSAIAHGDGGTIAHVSGSAEDAPRIAPMIWALADTGAFAQVVLAADAAGTRDALAELDAQTPLREVRGTVEAMREEIRRIRPVAIVTHADDTAGLGAALAAARLGVAVVRIGARPAGAEGRVIARLADLLLLRGEDDADPRFGPERTHIVGNPLIDAVRRAPRGSARLAGVQRGEYVLALLTGGAALTQLAAPLARLAAKTPLVIAAAPGIRVPGARSVPRPGFAERLALARGAGAVVTDSARVQEEAAVLGVRCYALAGSGSRVRVDAGGTTIPVGDERALLAIRPERNAPTPCAIPLWDGRAGARAADVLVANFARVRFG
ncbi:UDP-N-acetylglucosamine 2-epimerase [Candidatus Solirubrobacter pratensis]|uniref:UDP-N-acetylglucosamine 2-epimerase n=1 Tax=Candidatus Solirubrobacter pratensis TaxID=1298857 RepID=UPI0012DF130B|nr:UDP-N-acetylglucosamine 2-epimerase [Candidatus Solirubrobacter pratensis]